jgi:hypothetical protein
MAGYGDFSISVNANLREQLAALQGRGQSLDKAKPVIAQMLLGAVGDMFEAQGPGWAELSEATIRQRRGSSHVILQDTGIMAASAVPVLGPDFVDAVFGASYSVYHAPDAQGRDITDLGPFEAPLLEEVAAFIATQVT